MLMINNNLSKKKMFEKFIFEYFVYDDILIYVKNHVFEMMLTRIFIFVFLIQS